MASTFTGEPSRRGGSVDEAIANGRKLLDRDARVALLQAQTILRGDGANVPALYLAAAAHRKLGETAEAQNAEMAALKASGRDRLLQQISDLLARGELDAAHSQATARLRAVPEDLVAKTFLAETAIEGGRPHDAETLLEDVMARAPRFRPAESLYLRMLLALDRLKELRERLARILDVQPNDKTSLQLYSRVMSQQEDFDAAAEICRKVIDLEPGNARHWIVYAENLRFAGHTQDAKAAFRKVIDLNRDYGQAWWHLANIDAAGMTDEDLAAMRAALARVEGSEPEHAGNLHFAIALTLDKRKQYEEAFRHFAAGNALRREAQPYDPLELTRNVTGHLERLPASGIPPRADPKRGDRVPIFILGMPRSGSTLLERVLGQHSRIEALGELPLIPHMVERLAREPGAIEKRIASLSAAEKDELAERYLRLAGERMRTDKTYFVDKLHMNWKHLPLILRILPMALVIDIRRGGMDCCWSNYKTLFARGHPAASDQKSLGQFYRDYVRMTDTLRERAPGRIHFLRYEDLVDDFDAEMARLFGFLGLDFEDACRDFHRSKAPVATASAEQVRQPLNRKGMGAAEPYRPWLGELEEKLGSLAGG